VLLLRNKREFSLKKHHHDKIIIFTSNGLVFHRQHCENCYLIKNVNTQNIFFKYSYFGHPREMYAKTFK